MIRVIYPDNESRRLAFFLAMEEWVATNLPAGEYFYSWIVNPTVIIGRNQDMRAEVNLEYCRDHGIEVVRRRSGGGCVYADRDNIMISYICPETDVQKVFARYTRLVADQLCRMGVPAEPSGRNDITVGERKISGNAFYLLPQRSIVHGTMLYDTNIANMLGAITPSKAKLESHKVKSVEARITTFRRLRPEVSLEEFHRELMAGLETDRYILKAEEVSQIEEIERTYYIPAWHEKGESHSHFENINTIQE